MGPSELLISGLLATALVAPASVLIKSSEPGLSRYQMKDDCVVSEVVVSCIVDTTTGEQLGL